MVVETVRSGRLFRYAYDLEPAEQGKMTAALEREWRELMGVGYALCVTSGTAALEVALGAMGLGPGDEVIVPAWSWVSCFTSIVRIGAKPVLAEVDSSLCLAPGEIRRLCTARTKAVIVVHYQGVSADMDLLLAEAKEMGIRVLEDCAEACGAMYRGKRVGSMGDMAIYSLQNSKTITSGEGGMVVTKDPDLYVRAVRMHDIGLFRPHHSQFANPADDAFCGGQYRMGEITAAVALAQLKKLDHIRNHCRALGERVLRRIGALPGLEFRHIPDPRGDSGIEIYFFVESSELAVKFCGQLDALKVNCTKMTGTACHYRRPYCVNRAAHSPASSPFREERDWPAKGYRPEDFPMTENLVNRFIALPMGALYTVADADHIADSVIAVHQNLCFGS